MYWVKVVLFKYQPCRVAELMVRVQTLNPDICTERDWNIGGGNGGRGGGKLKDNC